MSRYEKADEVAEMIRNHVDGDEVNNDEAEVLRQCFHLLKWSRPSSEATRDLVRCLFKTFIKEDPNDR